MSPTPRASELQPLVSDALNKCRETLLLLNNETASYAGRTVIVGLSDDFELALGQPLLQKLHQQSPGLRVVFRQTHSQIAADMLLRHELDLALTAGGFTYRSLSKSHLATGGYACLIASTPDAPPPSLTLEAFIRRPHLLVSHGGYIGLMDEKLTELGLSRTVGASTTHFAAIPWLLKDSDLVTTIPAHAARAIAGMVPTLRCVPCPLAMPSYAIEIGCRQPALRDRPIQRVREALTESTTVFDWS
ncbi:LysR substrate-binding domain-containing protein [Lonsdalea quercina]|uniref:LysR substrate-binding domain-containing protein n=1 Tax=Lonsdalea quercina TaxID=71657 RepID=UPI0039753941